MLVVLFNCLEGPFAEIENMRVAEVSVGREVGRHNYLIAFLECFVKVLPDLIFDWGIGFD